MTPDVTPLGRGITVDQLTTDPAPVLAELREREPVCFVPALAGYLVTGRDLAIAAMRDAERFTVDDPRFTTAAVLGPSMLSLDGPEHARHRRAFVDHFRPSVVRGQFEAELGAEARRLVASAVAGGGPVEWRTQLAGPLAVRSITTFLGLVEFDVDDVLAWYRDIAGAILDLSLNRERSPESLDAVDALRRTLETTRKQAADSLVATVGRQGMLRHDEVISAVAVVMFGAIETSEAMTANLLWHLFSNHDQLEELRADRTLVAAAIEESLRLEPAAAVVDRYTTGDVTLGGVDIPERSLVVLSLLAANRDPAVFDDPDRFDIHRPNAGQHLSFVQGPHGCIGLHLARAETKAAIRAVLDLAGTHVLDAAASAAPIGLIFRKPPAIVTRRGPLDGGPTDHQTVGHDRLHS